MGEWKQLAEERGKLHMDSQQKVLALQHQLAEQAEHFQRELRAKTSQNSANTDAQMQIRAFQEQIRTLQRKLHDSEEQRDTLSKVVDAKGAQLNNALARFSAVENELPTQVSRLTNQVSQQHAQISAPRDLEIQLQTALRDKAKLMEAFQIQHEELAAERRANARRNGFAGSAEGHRERNEDDSEPELPPISKREPMMSNIAEHARPTQPKSAVSIPLTTPANKKCSVDAETPPKPKPAKPASPLFTPFANTKRGVEAEAPSKPQASRAPPAFNAPTSKKRTVDSIHTPNPLTPTAARKKRKSSASSDVDHLENPTFVFKMVTGHPSATRIDAYDSEEMKGHLLDLWKAIDKVQEIWEERKGELWQDEFSHKGYKHTANCITSRLTGKRVLWRKGCEGKYACLNCVKENRPCFTYTGVAYWLLPLHPADRGKEPVKGKEIRTWLNA